MNLRALNSFLISQAAAQICLDEQLGYNFCNELGMGYQWQKTGAPTLARTGSPSPEPTKTTPNPSLLPSDFPSVKPTRKPTGIPTEQPTFIGHGNRGMDLWYEYPNGTSININSPGTTGNDSNSRKREPTCPPGPKRRLSRSRDSPDGHRSKAKSNHKKT